MFERAVALMFVATVLSSNGQAAEDKCAKIPSIGNFDLEKIMGVWYPQKVASEEEVSKKCLYYRLTSDKSKANATVNAERVWERPESFKMLQKGNSSEFAAFWLGSMRTITLAATDYKNWAVWYICYPEKPAGSYIAIATRGPNPNEELIRKAEDAVKIHDFASMKPYITVIDRRTCKQN